MSNDDLWPWQPIDTAPKDGSDILVCCGPDFDPMFAVVHWQKSESRWLLWWAYPEKYADWAEYWQPIAPVPGPAH